jgi:predicted phage terminase large subunit-like protein
MRIVDLLSFIPAASPRFMRPSHLARAAALFERADREPVHAVLCFPPRFGKTEFLKHGIDRRLFVNPDTRVIYAGYSSRFSEKKSREARELFKRCGGRVNEDASAKADWRTAGGEGGVWATSVGGSVTGEGGDLIIIDDPHKGRAEAESALERDRVKQWFNDDVLSRQEPGASVFVVQTRWHPEDLAGSLIAEGWESVSLPALSNGKSLWPERYSAERLIEIREQIGEYSFSSLYQQAPVPKGGQLFQDVRFFDALPEVLRVGRGCDLAYSTKTRSDRSAAVVLGEAAGVFYVIDARAVRVPVPEFMAVIRTLDARHGAGMWHWYTSTTETGTAELATATAGVHIHAERASVDKFMRAQPLSAAWNAGKVLLPRSAPWLDALVAEFMAFTGVGDRHDDMIDAASSAFVSLGGSLATAPGRGIARPQFFRGAWGGGAPYGHALDAYPRPDHQVAPSVSGGMGARGGWQKW